MNDTQKRIEAYRKQLPGLKERVLAVALLLVVSITIGVTTTFAWVVLSRSPEVSGVSTSVASNGNLEIALATGEMGTTGSSPEPRPSQVGDSYSAENQTVTDANITWGNMINLTDPSYGLENLVLRPAQLNTADLLGSPLYGADYGPDGRITKLISNFDYTAWSTVEQKFEISNSLGVRAISSTKLANATADEEAATNLLSSAVAHNLGAATTYRELGNNTEYMQSLATMMGLFMTARMNPDEPTLNNPTIDIKDIQNLRDMYEGFLTAFDQEAEAIAQLINLGQFYASTGDYKPFTGEDVYNKGNGATQIKTVTVTKEDGTTITRPGITLEGQKDNNNDGAIDSNDQITIIISDLDQFIKDRNTIASDLEKLKTIADSGTSLKWTDSGISGIVNNLVDVGKCTIGADNTPISSIGASNAMGYLSGTQEARITNGILYRFEERTGGYLEVKGMSISATVKRMGITVPATVKANIQTTAPRDYNLFTNDKTTVETQKPKQLGSSTYVAEDTFGLAVDFWVRTNAQSHNLVLEGNVLTQTEEVEAKGKDANGNEVQLYVWKQTVTDESGNESTVDIDVYSVTEGEGDNQTTTWYIADTHAIAKAPDGTTPSNPPKKMETITTVVGYEGENRVWDKESNSGLSINSTTQGGGSCYVYYADTPEDQARSLKLLDSMFVAFVDESGKLMAKAYMNTAMHFAENGKVIVPLQMDPSASRDLGEDLSGEKVYGITALEKNRATRITAIVYLDGTKLTNSDVLAAADIQGQLNIQFGTYADDISGVKNEELMNKNMSVSASVNNQSFDYDTATGPMTTTVTVRVDGDEPSTVTAFFLRQINAHQGSREDKMTFKKQNDGSWTADHTFEVPGTYVLRTVTVDGKSYDIEDAPTVTVAGFAVKSLTCDQANNDNRYFDVLTSAGSTTANLSLQFAADKEDKLPKKVQGRFLRDDGSAVNVEFTYNPTNQMWTGSATFLTSGDYTMQYLVLDGEYNELDKNLWITATIKLGLRVEVYTTSPSKFKYVPSELTDNQRNLKMEVKILDNSGEELLGRSGVKLTYGMKGSSVKKMDTDLKWNGQREYYEGVFTIYSEEEGMTTVGGPGIWQFSNVTVAGDVITQATTSPTFTIQSPEPPEYYNHDTVTYQYKPNNDAVMNVHLTHSSSAAVQAYIIKDGAAEGVWVDGILGNQYSVEKDDKTIPVNYWNFTVPKDANGYQDGNWQLTQLKIWDAFAADGTEYTEENSLEIDVSDKNIKSKVVNRVSVTFAGGQSKDFGKDENGNVTGAFMQEYNVTGLSVKIEDFEHAEIKNLSDVQLKFTYTSKTSVMYGGYSNDQKDNSAIVVHVPLSAVDTLGTTYSQASEEAPKIQYAGSYTTELSFKINGTEYKYQQADLPANVPVITVSSVKPSVTITGVSNGTTAAIPTKITWTKNWRGALSYTLADNRTNSLDTQANTVTVYAKATTGSDGEGVGTGDAGFARPKLTFTASGIDASTQVAFTIPKGEANAAVNVTLTGTTAGEYTLGYTKEVYSSWSLATYSVRGYFGHGNQTISVITVTKGGIEYTVTLDKPIVINNPSSVNKTS